MYCWVQDVAERSPQPWVQPRLPTTANPVFKTSLSEVHNPGFAEVDLLPGSSRTTISVPAESGLR